MEANKCQQTKHNLIRIDCNIYHKRKVHNCEDDYSRRYDEEVKNATRRCMHCNKHHRKRAMEKHSLKNHKEKFTWIKCKLYQKEQQEEDHIIRQPLRQWTRLHESRGSTLNCSLHIHHRTYTFLLNCLLVQHLSL